MTTMQLEQYKELSKIGSKEILDISKIIFNSFITHKGKVSPTTANKKEQVIDSFSDLIEKIMNVSNSKEEKLILINFLDKLNQHREILEILSGERKLSDIELASERLGKKSQSAFETK